MSAEKEPGARPDSEPPEKAAGDGSLSAKPSAWGDQPELFEQARRSENRRLARRWGVALGTLVVVVAVWVVLERGLLSPEPLLEKARVSLGEVVQAKDCQARAEHAMEVETLLRRYLDRGGRQGDSARLLLAGALLQQSRGRQPTERERLAVDELLATVAPNRCATEYLLRGAWALASGGRADRADPLLSIALDRGEQREEALRMAAEVRITLGITEPLLPLCRELAELRPNDPQPWQMMIDIYGRLGQHSQLVDAERRLLELSPQAHEIHRWLVDDLVELGRAAEARKEFDLLWSRAPGELAQHPLTQARLLHLEGRRSEALAIVLRLLAAKPHEPRALLLAGRIHLVEGRIDEAIAALEDAVRVDPTVPDAHYLLGQAYTRKGLADKAKHQMELHRRVLDLRVKLYEMERQAAYRPNDLRVRNELVRIYEELGWKDRAEVWRRAGGRGSPSAEPQPLGNPRAISPEPRVEPRGDPAGPPVKTPPGSP